MTPGVEERPWLRQYGPNIPPMPAPAHATVLEAFAHAAAARPDHVLLRHGDRALSLRDVDRLSDRAAAALAARGFGAGDRLAIYLQSVPEFVLALLAAWKLGGIGVTVNPMYRERELDEVLRDSGARVLVCEADERLASVRDTAARAGVQQVIDCAPWRGQVTDGWTRLLDAADSAAKQSGGKRLPGADDPATFIYTSGTTGPLKAAVSTHRQLACSAEVYRIWSGLGADDAIIAVAPLVHVTGIVGYIALALATSATLVLTYRFTPSAFRDAVSRHRARFTIGPTTAFIALADSADVEAEALSSLDLPFSGGAPIPAAVVGRFREKFGHTILGIYGLTEATGPTHMVPRGRAAPVDSATGTLSVGVPVPGIECRILDDDGRVLGPMQPGEIVLGGPQIASGYWGRDAETRETFSAQGLRTGDIGFMDADGWLYVVDRKKDQINVSGFKVWPREVEDVLYGHPSVLECAVVGQLDDYRGEKVAAFIVLRSGHEATARQIEEHCRAGLAAYKVPRAIHFLHELPKTASGKVLRRALKELQPSKTPEATAPLPSFPTSPIQETPCTK